MSRAERDKGARGEREVVAIFREYFPDETIQRATGGTRQLSGDLVRVPGALVSVKRHEVLRLPLWIREAGELAARPSEAVAIAYRTNHDGPVPYWRGDLPLRDLARLLDLARLTA